MIKIRPFKESDWPFVEKIYQQGIDTKNATFQTKAKPWQAWNQSTIKRCRLVAEYNGQIAGWAALSQLSSRPVYAGVAEVSIYIATQHQGKGLGKQLLSALVTESEKAGFWTLQAVIFPENQTSIALHETCGFRVVGRREKLGKMDNRWRDVLLLERRSKIVGT